MAGDSNPNLVDHTVLSTTEFAEGEIAYRRRQAKGRLSWRELLVLGPSVALVLWFVANVFWSWLF